MFVATTGDRSGWPEDGPLLLMGEWCRTWENRDALAGRDVEVLPYHWGRSEKFNRDAVFLAALYERLLESYAGIRSILSMMRR